MHIVWKDILVEYNKVQQKANENRFKITREKTKPSGEVCAASDRRAKERSTTRGLSMQRVPLKRPSDQTLKPGCAQGEGE